MAGFSELKKARKQLTNVLGDDVKQYWTNMKLWFRQKVTKEEFDNEARRLLKGDNVQYHNEFLVAILAKCQSLTSATVKEVSTVVHPPPIKVAKKESKPVKKRRQSVKLSLDHRFVPIDPLPEAPSIEPRALQDGEQLSFCAGSRLLPDPSMLHGRMFVTAWEFGLDQIEDDTVSMMVHAAEQILKDILTQAFCLRSGYQVRHGNFRHAIGTLTHVPPIRTRTRDQSNWATTMPTTVDPVHGQIPGKQPSVEKAEAQSVMQAAISGTQPPRRPMSLYDLQDTLKMYKKTLPSHTVYSINMERIIAGLWHPSHEELDQDNLHREEKLYREEIEISEKWATQWRTDGQTKVV
ncbi:transcriptional adapter 1-like isoform X2 [Anneissia japonica]|uniref:transcriptional adapter 1-like isoform X2 n=1 Tax=Anneissia japonica TaxID=1529436 RepID=UPI0014254B53|nr:transcriptional adapter 1-like isoform X2 [Anneissia japonica]